jgi:hypothetical protein
MRPAGRGVGYLVDGGNEERRDQGAEELRGVPVQCKVQRCEARGGGNLQRAKHIGGKRSCQDNKLWHGSLLPPPNTRPGSSTHR